MKILRLRQVLALTGLPKSTLYLYIKNKTFPAQVKLGPKIVGWVEEEVLTWINGRIQIRNCNA